MTLKLPKPSALFLYANLALVTLLTAGILVGAVSEEDLSGSGDNQTRGSKSYQINRYYVETGDEVRVPPPWDFNGPVRDYVSFYIVEGGEADEFLAGRTPAHIYYSDAAPLAIDRVSIKRPAPPESKPHEPAAWKSTLDGFYGLDLVYVYDRSGVPSGDLAMTNGEWSSVGFSGPYLGNDRPVVVDGFLLALGGILFGVACAALLGVLLTGVYLAVSRRPAAADAAQPTTGATEGLVRLADAAREYLAHLRVMGRVNGLLVVVGGILGLTAANYYMSSFYEVHVTSSWNLWVMAMLWVAFFGLIVTWWLHYRRLTREFRRVTSKFSTIPIVS